MAHGALDRGVARLRKDAKQSRLHGPGVRLRSLVKLNADST